MSIIKTGVVLLLLGLVSLFALRNLNDRGLRIPTLGNGSVAVPASVTSPSEAFIDGVQSPPAEAASGPIVTKSMPLSNGPRVAPAPRLYDATTPRSSAVTTRYREILSSLEVDGCFQNGSFALKLDRGSEPAMFHSGQSAVIRGLRIKLKLIAYPGCRVQLLDDNRAFGEVAAL